MPLTENQCEKLRDAILNVYPAQNKAALESFLSEKFHINLEYILAYSKHISDYGKLNQITHKENNQKRNEIIKILILKIPAKDLDLDKELYEIKNAIKQSKNRKLLNYKTEIVYSTDDIRREIADEKPQIVHFCGHGLQDGTLKLDNSNSGVSPEVLKSIFQGREDTIKCVLLNACHSEKATLAITQHINYAIGMNNEIIDNVAIEFAKGFYDGLGYNNDNNAYLMAFNEGIRAIISKNISQKSVPVLRTRISYEEAIINLIKQLDAENKINELVKELKSHHPTNSLLRKFISYYEHPLNEDELNKFQTIINGVDDCAIQSAYGKLFTDDISDKNTIISKLVENDHKKSNIPLIVEFAKHLAIILKRKDNSQFENIKGWIDDISGRLNIDIIDITDQSSQETVYHSLFIKVDDEGDKLRLQSEIIENGENYLNSKALDFPNCNHEIGSECESFEKIPPKLDEILENYDNILENATVEIFVPMQYINKNIYYDWLKKFPDSLTCTLLKENRIRIHLIERTKKSFSFSLKQRFKDCKNRISERYPNNYLPEEEISKIYEKVHGDNSGSIEEKIRNKIGVKFYHKENQKELFFAVLRAGIPLVFWTKNSFPETMNLDEINFSLKIDCLDNNFEEIIRFMHDFFRKAHIKSNPQENLGYHLGFLCDYPLNIPKNSILQGIK
jgi:hypothetical protein